MSKRTIGIYTVDFNSSKPNRLATYELNDGKLTSTWKDSAKPIQDSISNNGIISNGEVLYPSDGEKFFNALTNAFSTSSMMYAKED